MRIPTEISQMLIKLLSSLVIIKLSIIIIVKRKILKAVYNLNVLAKVIIL